MGSFMFFCVSCLLAASVLPCLHSYDQFNVYQFGAKGDGKTDDSKAFLAAWHSACSSTTPSVVYIPPKSTFLLHPTSFEGPCKTNQLTMEVNGKLIASVDTSLWNREEHWVEFKDVNGLSLKGQGVLDGQGSSGWPKTCRNTGRTCNKGPKSLLFSNARNVIVEEISLMNSKQMHLGFHACENVKVYGLKIDAPRFSPNTDGIHVSHSSNVSIQDTVIRTGDDCISIVSESHNVNIQGGSCGPGHGISIGSLGVGNSYAAVSNVVVKGVVFHDTENGVRIKTWKGGMGYASHLTFQDLSMGPGVKNPITIDQSYCPRCRSVAQKQSAVKISDVLFKNIKGASATEMAIKIECSESVPCEGVKAENVQLNYSHGQARCLVTNTRLTATGLVYLPCH